MSAMVKDAASTDFYESPNGKKYARGAVAHDRGSAGWHGARRAPRLRAGPELQEGKSGKQQVSSSHSFEL